MPYDKWKETKGKRTWTVKRVRISKRKPKKMRGRIKATQYAIKRTKNSYDLITKGRKY